MDDTTQRRVTFDCTLLCFYLVEVISIKKYLKELDINQTYLWGAQLGVQWEVQLEELQKR